MQNSSVENIAGFNLILDPYNGVTINEDNLCESSEEFDLNLDFVLEEIKNRRNLIWIYICIEKASFIPIATKKGFFFHSCDKDYILLVKRLKPNAIVPTAANHTLGVGAVVINEKNELLVIKERISTQGYKLPGGHIDNTELISNALIREVYEETGIKVEFESIISLGHFYPHQFHKSNLYIVCLAKPLTNKITIFDKEEILDAKWVNINEYLIDEEVLSYSKAIVSVALKNKGFKIDNKTLNHIKKDIELFFPLEK